MHDGFRRCRPRRRRGGPDHRVHHIHDRGPGRDHDHLDGADHDLSGGPGAAGCGPGRGTRRFADLTEQEWTPFATVGGITLRHPSSRVERVGFHEANHDGARQLEPLATAVAPATMETRGRATGSRSAADVVVDPTVEIRAPVSGTVVTAGSYVLYCDYSDDYVIIDPDAHPGWQVKILHIDGLQVGVGDRVVGGRTVLASGPTQLPFGSQVDEARTADPAWPHTHIEVIDPSIPDIPSPGGGGCT